MISMKKIKGILNPYRNIGLAFFLAHLVLLPTFELFGYEPKIIYKGIMLFLFFILISTLSLYPLGKQSEKGKKLKLLGLGINIFNLILYLLILRAVGGA